MISPAFQRLCKAWAIRQIPDAEAGKNEASVVQAEGEGRLPPRSIERVPDKGKTGVGKMSPDLVPRPPSNANQHQG